jgi:uncharacterized protein (TIGR02246 family)
MKRCLALGVFLVLAAAPGLAQAQERTVGVPSSFGSAADEAALREWLTQYIAAWNASDAAKMETFYADDATIVDEWGKEIKGRAAIVKDFAESRALDDFKGATIAITADTIRFIRPDLAVSQGTYTVTGGKLPPEGLKGHYQNVAVKQGGSWKTVTLHLAAMPPPLPPQK